MSDDGQHCLTIIAFVGSVFSPYYAWARAHGRGNPDNFCALNVALYSRHAKRWSMTERGQRHCTRQPNRFVIGASQLHWDGSCLHIHIDELCAPLPRRIRGHIQVTPDQLFSFSTALDPASKHRWGPIAPTARIKVQMEQPSQNWAGTAYFDCNEGDEPIDRAFKSWDWSRTTTRSGNTSVVYDLRYPDATEKLFSLQFGRNGSVTTLQPLKRQNLPRTAWWVARRVHTDTDVRVEAQLEDTPFYQRAILKSADLGESVTSFHETLSVPRLISPIVRAMLTVRMPRRA